MTPQVLAFIAARWLAVSAAAGGPGRLVAIHLDYGNRAESAAEAAYVAWWCGRLGFGCHVRRIDEVTRGRTARDECARPSSQRSAAASKGAADAWLAAGTRRWRATSATRRTGKI